MNTAILTTAILSFSAASVGSTPNFTVSVNENAPVKCNKTIFINAAPEKVWQVLTDVNNWPKWNKDIPNAKINGEIKPGTTFDWKTGGASIHSAIHTADSCRALGWTGKTFGASAIHNWTLVAENGGTTVKVDESMDGFLSKLFKKSFQKNLEKGMLSWLEQLKVECEL
jgi:uncharacterized protein YndB with AHSA1/START domain